MKSQSKTWVEIRRQATAYNIKTLKALLKPNVKFFAVVKSNAYGHGLTQFSKVAQESGADGFCVDSVIEGLKLRQSGIKKPILTLGPTLNQTSLIEAFKNKIAISISSFDLLLKLIKSKFKPDFHLKIDTGMHRQGLYIEDLKKILRLIGNSKSPSRLQESLKGIYTHFSSAKDLNYPTFTELQFKKFQMAVKIIESNGFPSLIKHAAATGGVLINQKYHLNAVRVGIGAYGLYPSPELEIQLSRKMKLKPVLSWHATISEIKIAPANSFIGYDLAERVLKPTKIAIVPIGYWHGYDRKLSINGEVLIHGSRAPILGKISMDIIAVNANRIPAKVGDRVTLIGKQKNEEISATQLASKIGTTHYEILTRINPLIERLVI